MNSINSVNSQGWTPRPAGKGGGFLPRPVKNPWGHNWYFSILVYHRTICGSFHVKAEVSLLISNNLNKFTGNCNWSVFGTCLVPFIICLCFHLCFHPCILLCTLKFVCLLVAIIFSFVFIFV